MGRTPCTAEPIRAYCWNAIIVASGHSGAMTTATTPSARISNSLCFLVSLGWRRHIWLMGPRCQDYASMAGGGGERNTKILCYFLRKVRHASYIRRGLQYRPAKNMLLKETFQILASSRILIVIWGWCSWKSSDNSLLSCCIFNNISFLSHLYILVYEKNYKVNLFTMNDIISRMRRWHL